MAGQATHEIVPSVTEANDELSDEQFEKLIQEAEDRLRAAQNESTALTLSKEAEVLGGITRMPKLAIRDLPKSYLETRNNVIRAEPTRLIDGQDAKLFNEIRKIDESDVRGGPKKDKKMKATAGPEWFDMPKTNLTTELKRDLQLIKMRSVLDPKRHYKKDNSKQLAPDFSQVGTIIEGPTEFFSARINNRDRKRTFVEEVMSDETKLQRFKSKYGEIQEKNASGKKNHYKALQAKRYKMGKKG